MRCEVGGEAEGSGGWSSGAEQRAVRREQWAVGQWAVEQWPGAVGMERQGGEGRRGEGKCLMFCLLSSLGTHLPPS